MQITSDQKENEHTHTRAGLPNSRKRHKIVHTWASGSVVSLAFCFAEVSKGEFPRCWMPYQTMVTRAQCTDMNVTGGVFNAKSKDRPKKLGLPNLRPSKLFP